MATEEPSCDFNETDKAGYVRVRMRIPGIKPGPGGIFSKAKQAEKGNAEIEGPQYENDQSVTLLIHDKGGLDGTNYRYHVKKLPDQILSNKTEMKIQNDWVIMFLKKKNKDKSWESYFRNGSLETE